ncbi:MAG: cysteine-rich CWC family protein [Ferruginibacter sp.]
MENKHKHEEKICARCGNAFVCKAGDIINCQCHGISCTNEAIEFVSERYDDCLCRGCLVSLNNGNR